MRLLMAFFGSVGLSGDESATPAAIPQADFRLPSTGELDAARVEIERRIAAGSDPAADAVVDARSGRFGLIVVGGRYASRPGGVMCFTPSYSAPETRAVLRYGGVIDERASSWSGYATGFNRAMVEQPNYPYADLCRLATEPEESRPPARFPMAVAARAVTTAPATLHEAARRGSLDDIRRLLAPDRINARDSMGLTPLAWAIARNRTAAIDLLLDSGASAWTGSSESPIRLAAYFGRGSLFQRLQSSPNRPFSRWPHYFLASAVEGGDPSILALMLEQDHDRFSFPHLAKPLPRANHLEPILRDDPRIALDLLWETTNHGGDRPDLVRLALRYGADSNVTPSGRYGTVLGHFATGIGENSVEIVRILLDAGADPNLISHRQRPLMIALGGMKLDGLHTEATGHAQTIFRILLERGADINLPDDQGVPPARLLLFPYRGSHDELDASFVTPALLQLLVGAGLDLNATWQGRRILTSVEAQAGRDSELAVTLRRLGARH